MAGTDKTRPSHRRARVAWLAACAAAPASIHAASLDPWPPHLTFGDGTEVAPIGVYRYDANDFGNDELATGRQAFADARTSRRKELGITLRKTGVYDAVIDFEYRNRTWLDTFVRVQSQAVLGADAGAFRVGYSKTPVAFEGVTSTKADSFVELSLPAQAIFEGRRTGVDWAFERPLYLLNAGYYWGQDLLGDNDGTTLAAHAAFTPRKSPGDVLHLGVAASRERRDATSDGRGIEHPPSARIGTPPEAGLTPVRLVDSGMLANVGAIDRAGVEALWIRGPWSLQGEALRERVARRAGDPAFAANGFYVFGSWLVTGESRPYAGGNVGNVRTQNTWGAVELLLRYSELDLNSGAVLGGRERDWTLGANWYATDHVKFQANVIRVWSERGNLTLDPRIVELRVQIQL